MKIILTARAEKTYKKLPLNIKLKTDKKLQLLLTNIKHPSLRVKKMTGINRFEARIDYHYRLTFIMKNNNIYILTIGPHDEGLGKL
ncbi:MAG: hypothetical protein QHH09_02005 [Microgenomates group bacterium]|nr:hypothetical protein [Microgenomates group bacterium]